jgi:hypothetical protein
MATPDNTPQPPRELIAEGERWARERFLADRGEEIFEGMRCHFESGMDLFQCHRARLAAVVEEEGGVQRVEHHVFDGSNFVECRSGKRIWAHELLNMEPIELPAPDLAAVPDGTRQTYAVRISFGGEGLGVMVEDAQDRYRVNSGFLQADDPLERFFAPDFQPTAFAVTETVSTGLDGDHQELTLFYALTTRYWLAKLREEFAPNPFQDPEGYRRWAESAPIEMTDMRFWATDVTRDEASGKLALEHRRYMSEYKRVEGGDRAALKFLRFEELLKLVYEHVVPADARPARRTTPIRELAEGGPKALPVAAD